MCQPKNKGGKRCAIHQKGSVATLNTTQKITGEDMSVVQEVFKGLRKEGSKLPAPTREQVEDFARAQAMRLKYSPDVSEHDKKIIGKQWDKVNDEELPEGSTFHAWKNTMAQVAARSRSKIAAVAVSSVVSLSLAACGGGNLANNPEPSAPINGGSSTSAPAVSEPTPTESVAAYNGPLDYANNDKLGVNASDTTLSDQYGSYQQAELEDDSPLAVYNPDTADDAVKAAYSEEELQSAQLATSQFLVSESLDSPLVWDDSQEARDAFIAKTAPFVDDNYENDYRELFTYQDGKGYIVADSNDTQWRESLGYEPAPYQKDLPRYAITDAKVSAITQTEDGGLRLDYDLDYNREVIQKATGDTYVERVTATRSYGLTKSADGSWQLSGWAQQAEFNFTAAS
jgi:hypothetical protein